MSGLTIAFVVIAVINLLINLYLLIVEPENKPVAFSAVVGWSCAIMHAIF